MFKNKTFIILLVLILSACGKPDVVKIEQPKDKNLNCENLKLAILEAEQYKKKAMGTREGTAANVARNLLFWPSLVGTMLNADKAIQAAEDRIYHLQVLSIRKNCGININIKQLGFISQLKELKQLRDTGNITQEEYEQGKKKLTKK
jgi:hypothetical protein|tara:strand:- start:896 stop:1336 length:441 start_codon:yes stop_codon:yes gene_type:complete